MHLFASLARCPSAGFADGTLCRPGKLDRKLQSDRSKMGSYFTRFCGFAIAPMVLFAFLTLSGENPLDLGLLSSEGVGPTYRYWLVSVCGLSVALNICILLLGRRLVSACSVPEEKPLGLGPSRFDVIALDGGTGSLRRIHDIMGASCFMFMMPLVTYVALYYFVGVAADAWASLAFGASAFLIITSICSFLGDYWFTGPNVEDTQGTPYWHKYTIANKIDNVTAYGSATLLVVLSLVQIVYAPGANWIYAVGLATFAVAVYIKLLAARRMSAFTESACTCPDTESLWWSYFYHAMWHLCAAIGPSIQIYGLLLHGLSCGF